MNPTSGLTVVAAAGSPTCVYPMTHCTVEAQSGEFDQYNDQFFNPYQLTFSDGAHIAYTEQDFDGDPNFFDTHQTEITMVTELLIQKMIIQTTPQDGRDCDDGQYGQLTCIDAHRSFSIGTLGPDRVPARNIPTIHRSNFLP